jgi:hypothetical protein
MVRLAQEMRTGHRLRVASAPDDSATLRSAALESLSDPALPRSPEALRSAIAVVSAADWVQQLEALLRDLEAPVAATFTVNSKPWCGSRIRHILEFWVCGLVLKSMWPPNMRRSSSIVSAVRTAGLDYEDGVREVVRRPG